MQKQSQHETCINSIDLLICNCLLIERVNTCKPASFEILFSSIICRTEISNIFWLNIHVSSNVSKACVTYFVKKLITYNTTKLLSLFPFSMNEIELIPKQSNQGESNWIQDFLQIFLMVPNRFVIYFLDKKFLMNTSS